MNGWRSAFEPRLASLSSGAGAVQDDDEPASPDLVIPDPDAAAASEARPRVRKAAGAFRTISEVADELHIPQHVLRFWETRFPQVKPLKRGGGRRYYRPRRHFSPAPHLRSALHSGLYDQGRPAPAPRRRRPPGRRHPAGAARRARGRGSRARASCGSADAAPDAGTDAIRAAPPVGSRAAAYGTHLYAHPARGLARLAPLSAPMLSRCRVGA